MQTTESCLTGCIVVLCGIPASGKSTLTENLCYNLTNQPTSVDNFHAQSICYDKIIPADLAEELIQEKFKKRELCSEVSSEAKLGWKHHRQLILVCVDSLIESISTKTVLKRPSQVPVELWEMFTASLKPTWPIPMNPSTGCVAIVIDDNMYYSSMRYQYYQLAKKYTLGYCQVFVTCHIVVAKRRNALREESVPNHVIEKMAEKMEPPDPDQNKWEINSVTIDTATYLKMDTVLEFILKASKNPVKPVEEVDVVAQEESRQMCSLNQLHQIDQILRKIVTKYFQTVKDSTSSIDLQEFAQRTKSIKTLIHRKLKEGSIMIPDQLLNNVYEASKNTTNPLFIFIENIFEEHMDKEPKAQASPL